MARTEAGRELTVQHRLDQVLNSARVASDTEALLELFDLGNIDGSAPEWMAAMENLTRAGRTESMRLARQYLEEFSLVESGQKHRGIVTPMFDQRAALEGLRINGPVRMKAYIKQGFEPEEALAKIYTAVAGDVMTTVMNAGRELHNESVRYFGRSGKYRRVTDGKPCAFCAMIASRGPVYSEVTKDFRVHDFCGCTSEQVFGEWVPNDEEALWRASYKAAALDADEWDQVRIAPKPDSLEEDTILWRMRRNSPGLFSDGVRNARKFP